MTAVFLVAMCCVLLFYLSLSVVQRSLNMLNVVLNLYIVIWWWDLIDRV